MTIKTGLARGIKWKPNGVAEQAAVVDEISRASELYTAIIDRLKRISDEADRLKEEIRSEVEHAENSR
jgi:hypothetical protein